MSSRQLQIAMEKKNPTLELKIVSASNLSHIDGQDKLDVYAVVSIDGSTSQRKQTAKTPIDYDGGSYPTWNHTVRFSIDGSTEVGESPLTVKVKLFSYCLEREDDFYLGEVNVSVLELLASNPLPTFANGNANKMKSMICPIKVTGESTKATLRISHRFKPVAPDYSPMISQPIYPNPDPAISNQSSVVFSSLSETSTTKLILEMEIKFAKEIEDVNAFFAMDVYASVAILKDRKVKYRINTPIDFAAYKNPEWNHPVKFSFDDKIVQQGCLILLIELMSHRPFLGDKEIGFLRLPIKQLLASNPPSSLTKGGDANGMKLETHVLTGPYGKKGVVSFAYRFLANQVTIPTVQPPSTTPQPYIIYRPVLTQSYASSDPNQGTSGYVNGGGSNNGLVPIYMPTQNHGYQQDCPQPQLHQQSPP